MSDIAERVGVSKVAVSAVLSGSAGNHTRVAEATRRRILDAAREMNYAPNGLAKMFRQKSTGIIGLYLGEWLLSTQDMFLAEIVGGLQWACNEFRKDLLIHGTFRGQSTEDIYLELISRKIDGLILFAREDDALAQRLALASMPVVAIADAVSTLPSVVVDDCLGSRLIVEYLASKGHRRALYRRGRLFQTSERRRYEAFQSAAAQHGMSVVEDAERAAKFEFGLSEVEKAILKQPLWKRPTAIVCNNDLLAYASVDYCQDEKLRVPDDVAIVGFDGLVPQIRPAAQLTTIRAPWSQVAHTALALVVQHLGGESIPDETVLPVELVIGDTA